MRVSKINERTGCIRPTVRFLSITVCLCDLLTLSNTLNVECESGWTESKQSGTCLKLFNDEMSWDDARKSCQSKGTDLVKIIDSKMNAFVMTLIPAGVPVFFGIKKNSQREKARWLDETEESKYLNFKRPKVNREGTWCAVMNNKSLDMGQWDVVDCESKQMFMCEKAQERDGKCSPGWSYSGFGACMKVFKEKKSWQKGRHECKSLNADLLRSTLEQTNYYIASRIKDDGLVYIGLRVINKKSVWLDHEHYEWNYMNFSPYLTDKPGTLCGQLNNRNVAHGKWELVDCTSSHKYICEKDKGLCPKGWTPSAASGTCIKIYDTVFKEEKDSRKHCQLEGGDLVQISDENMNQFITDQVYWHRGRNYLIGLNDLVVPYQYRWLNLKENDQVFTNWAVGEPTDPSNWFNCTNIWHEKLFGFSKWVAVPCSASNRVICEKYADCDKKKNGMVCPKNCFNCKRHPLYSACNPRIGYCYFGCANPDFHCQDVCATGFYGEYCSNRCNSTCGGSSNKCARADGKCSHGCDIGYQGPWCETVCDTECEKICSDNCAGDEESCDHESGTCLMGCKAGFQGPLCNRPCFNQTYGMKCSRRCSDSCVNQACDNVNGSCTMGCIPGFEGPLCSEQSLRSSEVGKILFILKTIAIIMGIADFTLVLCLCGKKNKNLEPAEAEAVLTWDATYQGDAEDTETAMYQ